MQKMVPECKGEVLVEGHVYDSQGQILALAFRYKSSIPCKLFFLRAEATPFWPVEYSGFCPHTCSSEVKREAPRQQTGGEARPEDGG